MEEGEGGREGEAQGNGANVITSWLHGQVK